MAKEEFALETMAKGVQWQWDYLICVSVIINKPLRGSHHNTQSLSSHSGVGVSLSDLWC